MPDPSLEVIASARAVVEMWRRGDPAEIEGRNWSAFDHAILALDQALANMGSGQLGGPCPRPWYRPAVMWEWQRPWRGFHRLDEQDVIPGLPPVRTLFIGPITLTWLGTAREEETG